MNDIEVIIVNNNIKREESLIEYACKSINGSRIVVEKEDIRPMFFRDVDRIIHTNSYARYMDKTQVFVFSTNDNVSRRMLHVQLVSKIARTIGRALQLNEDLIEAMSLGHDVGHVPFGHFGERVLNELSMANNEGIFMHNVQSVRTFMEIERNGNGINLTLQTLDGILCHNGELLQEVYEPNWNKTWDIFLNEYNECYKNENKVNNLKAMTLEGCVTRISDIIAYIGRDIEDAIRLGLITRQELPNSIINILGNKNTDIVHELIMDIVKNSYGKKYLSMSSNVYDALLDLKDFNYKNIYFPAISEIHRHEYSEMIKFVFYKYLEDLNNNTNNTDINKVFLKDMSDKYIQSTSNVRKVLDYISGMTDTYLMKQYLRLKE